MAGPSWSGFLVTFILTDCKDLFLLLHFSVISFRYKLMSYDENYPKYLEGLGIPWLVVQLILGASETVTITKEGNTIKTRTLTGRII